MSFKKVILISGGTRGIGLSTAQRFCKEGWYVIICARNKIRIDNVVNDLRIKGYQIDGFQADLQVKESCEELLESVLKLTPQIDTLINNVGGLQMEFGGLEDLDEHSWYRAYDLNFLTAVRLSKFFPSLTLVCLF